MGLGTLPYPTPSPGAGGGSRGSQNTAPRPVGGPTMPVPTGVPGAPTAANQPYLPSQGMNHAGSSIVDQFAANQFNQRQGLRNQWAIDTGFGQLGYDNNMWYKQAQADNDLARLALQEGRDVGLAKETNNLDRMFAGRGFDIDSRGNALTRDMRYRANDSEAAAKGSISSFGYGQNNRDILGQFGIAQDTTQLQYDKKMTDLAQSDKAIDSLAKEYGIRKNDVTNALKFSATGLGLDWAQTQQQLNEMLASDDAALNQQALNFMAQLMAIPAEGPSLTDLFPNGVPTLSAGQMAQRAPRAGVGGDVPPNLGQIDPTKQVF